MNNTQQTNRDTTFWWLVFRELVVVSESNENRLSLGRVRVQELYSIIILLWRNQFFFDLLSSSTSFLMSETSVSASRSNLFFKSRSNGLRAEKFRTPVRAISAMLSLFMARDLSLSEDPVDSEEKNTPFWHFSGIRDDLLVFHSPISWDQCMELMMMRVSSFFFLQKYNQLCFYTIIFRCCSNEYSIQTEFCSCCARGKPNGGISHFVNKQNGMIPINLVCAKATVVFAFAERYDGLFTQEYPIKKKEHWQRLCVYSLLSSVYSVTFNTRNAQDNFRLFRSSSRVRLMFHFFWKKCLVNWSAFSLQQSGCSAFNLFISPLMSVTYLSTSFSAFSFNLHSSRLVAGNDSNFTRFLAASRRSCSAQPLRMK